MRSIALVLTALACTPSLPEGPLITETDTSSGLDFSAVDAVLERALASNDRGIPGLSLQVWDADGVEVHRAVVGDFDIEARIPVASASKLITSLVLLRLIDRGVLSPQSTTREVLRWGGEPITLDELNSFVSGLPVDATCTSQLRIDLQDCAATIGEAERVARPGERVDYGSTHQHAAGAMAEVVSGKTWNTLFRDEIALPLGLEDEGLVYVTYPRWGTGTTNPLVAGGLLATPEEYGVMLRLILADGTHDGELVLQPGSVDRVFENRHTGAEPGPVLAALGAEDWRYGYGSWLECSGPVPSCDVINSAGAFGMVPWVDRAHGYTALLSMQAGAPGASRFSIPLEQELQPLIVEALGQRER